MATAALATLAHAGDTNALSLRPRGAYVASDPNHAVFKLGSEYRFRYTDGAVARQYVIDMSSPNVAEGMLEVKELASQSYPIYQGGLAWLHAGAHVSPVTLSTMSVTTLLHEHLDVRSETLTLKYRDEVDHDGLPSTAPIPAAKTYEFRLVGKVLRIRAYADNSLNSSYDDNYYYLRPGRSSATTNVREQYIPYMGNAIVCGFQQPGGAPLFYGLQLDYYASNGALGSGISVPLSTDPPPPAPVTNSYEHFYPMVTLPSSAVVASVRQVLAPVDDTLNVIVTSRIEDTFPVPPNYRSPYYQLCSGRMEVWGGRDSYNSWFDYEEQYKLFEKAGLTDLNIQQFTTLTYPGAILLPTVTCPAPLGCTTAALLTLAPSVDPVTKLHVLNLADPIQGPAIETVANAEFGALNDAARATGALFAHTVGQAEMDPWHGPPVTDYTSGGYPCPPMLYEDHKALGRKIFDWHFPPNDLGFGMMIPAANPNLDLNIVVRDVNDQPKAGWDAHGFLDNTSWDPAWPNDDAMTFTCPPGYAEAFVSETAMFGHMKKQLEYGRQQFRPNCLRIDELSGVGSDLLIDQVAGSPRCHTAADVWRERTRTFRELRRYIGGPLFGEGYYWRSSGNYDHGLRDGHPLGFPAIDNAETDLVGNEEGPVVPDYNLSEVLAKSSGHSGVGQEQGHRWPTTIVYPFDADPSFFDSWITATATYGNNAYLSSSGHFYSPAWTYQGMLRSYFTINGLARRIRESKLLSVEYLDANNTYRQLGEAIVLGLDLTNPRVRIRWTTPSTGTLTLYANHSIASAPHWTVSVPVPGGGTETLALDRNGFAAGDGEKLLVFFNARPAGFTEFFDYTEQVGVHKMINARRSPLWSAAQIDYRGFPSELSNGFSPSDAALFANGMIARSYFATKAVGALGGVWNRLASPPDWASGRVAFSGINPVPTLTGLHIESDADQELLVNKAEGFVAVATYSNGATRDVSALVGWGDGVNSDWSVTGGLATIDQSGAVIATAAGTNVTVHASWAGFTASTASLSVVDGRPSGTPTITATGYAGETAKLDVPDVLDPKGGHVDVLWNPGDGTPVQRGRAVSHTYHEPGNYTVATTLGDVEENERALTTIVSVASSSSILWADDFDDGTLDGWSFNGGERWGIVDGALRQGESGATYKQATIAGEVFPLSASFGAQLRMRNLGAGIRAAGVHVRKLNESDLPLASGYSVIVKSNGMIAIQEPFSNNPLPPTPTVQGFDSSVPHDLRVTTFHDVSAAATTVRVFLDGVQYIDWIDTTPPSNGYASVTSLNQQPDFDDVRVHAHQAPYISASQLHLDAIAPTPIKIHIDDQDSVHDFSETNLELDVVVELAAGGTQSTHYSSTTTPSIATLFGTWMDDPNGTTRFAPLSTSVETLRGTAPHVRLEFTIPDSAGRIGRRVLRY